jgi:hypothetical protein
VPSGAENTPVEPDPVRTGEGRRKLEEHNASPPEAGFARREAQGGRRGRWVRKGFTGGTMGSPVLTGEGRKKLEEHDASPPEAGFARREAQSGRRGRWVRKGFTGEPWVPPC